MMVQLQEVLTFICSGEPFTTTPAAWQIFEAETFGDQT
jgi:hypothetical protein